MKPRSTARLSFPLAAAIIGIAAVALPLTLTSQAADVTWGAATNIVNSTDIQSAGITNLAGADFGRANGTTTLVNNGVGETGGVDVEFMSMNGNQTVGLSNGVTVSSTFTSFNVAAGNAAPAGNYKTVLSRHMGQFGGSPTITLSGLVDGTQYQIQLFASGGDNNNVLITGGPSLSVGGGAGGSGFGHYAVGTFTATGSSQVLTISGGEPVMNALTIGVVSSTDTTPPTLAGSDIVDDQGGGAVSVNTLVTYTVTFSEDMNASTVTADDFENADNTTTISIGTVTESSPGVCSVPVTPTSVGTLQLQVKAGAILKDVAGNDLDTTTAITDDTTLTVNADTSPPAWIAGWPQADPLSPTSLTVRAKTDETGTAYYVVLATGATAPTAAQVQAGNDSTDAPALKSGSIPVTANTEATAPVTGLTTDSTYDVWFVAEDAVPYLQAAPSMVSVSLVSPAVITWEPSWTAVTDNTAIQTLGGYTTYGGVNFNGSTTTINNGSTDVEFTGIAQNASGTAAGITVGNSGFNFQSPATNNSNVVSAVGTPQTWTTVLDRVIGDFDNSATIDLTGLTAGSSYYVQFFSSAPDGNILNNSKITSGGVDSPTFGLHASGGTKYIIATFTAVSTSQSFSMTGTEPTYSALVIGVRPAGGGNTFADWIGTFSGLNGLTGFNDDADADGLDNGLENFLGTAPNAGNAGLTAGTLSGNTFTFTHPQNATPASDVSAPAYSWSTDLQTFHASGASAGGITVDLVAAPNTPSPENTTVTATVTGTTPSKLFVRLGVTQQ